ncbi:MAG: helix-turn-helix domain-containing protein [Oscillospiraceae bacterium]|nr:helix-turn-helix domain-containing protein [Oscillospiraceae bacterium]
MTDHKYLPPKDAAPILGLSVATITRCVKNGAPVHRWGSTGRRYRIDVDEFRRWMERKGQEKLIPRPVPFDDVDELARRRRASVRAV